MPTKDQPFYTFLREERQFCAVLAHLLMQKGENLTTFVRLVNQSSGQAPSIPTDQIESAEIYFEFAYLRDYWNGLGEGVAKAEANAAKVAYLRELWAADPALSLSAAQLDLRPLEFNQQFMGVGTRAIKADIASPHHWSVSALDQLAPNDESFLALCKLKWSFNIKPDLVVVIPDAPVICIEAKLESAESWYPSNATDSRIFDRRFGLPRRRVHQVELQNFMFAEVLGRPCRSVVIAKLPSAQAEVPMLAWGTIFSRLDWAGSTPFVSNLLGTNNVLMSSYAWDRIWNGG